MHAGGGGCSGMEGSGVWGHRSFVEGLLDPDRDELGALVAHSLVPGHFCSHAAGSMADSGALTGSRSHQVKFVR